MAHQTGRSARRILVALDLAHQSGRDHLTGIYRFADAQRNWEIRIVSSANPADGPVLAQLLKSPFDGAIVRGELIEPLAQLLAQASIPLVTIDEPYIEPVRHAASAAITNDNLEIGRTAADHFIGLGQFATYAVLPLQERTGWAVARERAFVQRLEKARHATVAFPAQAGRPVSTRELADWLKRLPRPIALFAVYDVLAAQALDACREARLSVPGDMSVLGVDNDTLVCEHTRPKLSSIRPDHEGQGFAAARELNRLLGKGAASPRTQTRAVTCPHLGVVERESTAFVAPSVQLARNALALVEEHATDGLRASDVVRRLGVSMRLANLRFSQAYGHSIREALVRRRLREACRLLSRTAYPTHRIATHCGFSSAVVFIHLFTRRFGLSPLQWRRAHAPAAAGHAPAKRSP